MKEGRYGEKDGGRGKKGRKEREGGTEEGRIELQGPKTF